MQKTALSRQFGEFVAATATISLGPAELAAAKRAFIDTIGVILAGRNEMAVTKFGDLLRPGDKAFSWAGNRWLRCSDAAMLNGMAGHVLDYDDVAQAGHPSVVLVPAILAVAQVNRLPGMDALRAYLVGFDIWCEIARREPDAYHLGSWHPTATIGIIAATMAVCSLLRTDIATTQNALGAAASMASGLIANFGSPMKPLQAGRAAANAIHAVELARAGLGGAEDALDDHHGLLRGISPNGSVDCKSPAEFDPGIWRLLDMGLSVKRYPVCYAAHRAIDATIAMAIDEGVVPEAVHSIDVEMAQAPADTLRYHHPQTGLEARFSLHHNLAAALVRQAVGFAELSDDFVRSSDISALYALTKSTIIPADCPDQPGLARHDRVRIQLKDGRSLDSGPIRHPAGHAAHPMSDDQLVEKFLDCAAQGGFDDGGTLLDRLRHLEGIPDMRKLAQ